MIDPPPAITGCYLFHFSAPLGSERKQARHYLGWAENIATRVAEHRAGNSRAAAITHAAVARGITLTLVAVWPGASRDDEARLKYRRRDGKRGSAPQHARLCPLCRPDYLARMAIKTRNRRERAKETSRGTVPSSGQPHEA